MPPAIAAAGPHKDRNARVVPATTQAISTADSSWRNRGDGSYRVEAEDAHREHGHDADDPTGPRIPVGGAVTWTYVVTNTGDVDLYDIRVRDNREGISEVIDFLAQLENFQKRLWLKKNLICHLSRLMRSSLI